MNDMQRLAATIEQHWHGLGFTTVQVQAVDEYTIKSNLKNGLPPNHYFRGRAGRIVEKWS